MKPVCAFSYHCIIALTIIFLVGCSKDDSNPVSPAPDPVADFTWSGTTVTPATITFSNQSTNADRYQWDFGDGRTSIQANPSLAFNSHGTFRITLVATASATSKSDTVTENLTITPGMVFLDSVVVESIPWVNEDGAGWDLDGTGPDIYPAFIDSNGTIYVDDEDHFILNATPASLPLTWVVEPEARITNWGMEYTLVVFDLDYPEAADLLGGATFSINSIIRNQGYPRTITLNGDPDLPQANLWRARLVFRWQ